MDCAAMSSAENTWMLKMKSCAAQQAHCQLQLTSTSKLHRHRACTAAQTAATLVAQNAENCRRQHMP